MVNIAKAKKALEGAQREYEKAIDVNVKNYSSCVTKLTHRSQNSKAHQPGRKLVSVAQV